MRRAPRSQLIGQAATLSIAIVLILALFGPDVFSGVTKMIATLRLRTPLLLAIGIAVSPAPIGGYLAIAEKSAGLPFFAPPARSGLTSCERDPSVGSRLAITSLHGDQ